MGAGAIFDVITGTAALAQRALAHARGTLSREPRAGLRAPLHRALPKQPKKPVSDAAAPTVRRHTPLRRRRLRLAPQGNTRCRASDARLFPKRSPASLSRRDICWSLLVHADSASDSAHI